jgi:molybdopterin-binding protein
MFQAQQLADRAAVLREGELVGVGKVEEIFGRPSDFLASFARLENVFSGTSHIDEEGIARIDIGAGLVLEAATTKKGKITVFIRPEEIILSSSPLVSSARNTFKGKVLQTTDLNRNVQVKVDVGKEFAAIVTKRSFQEMQLNLGSEVYLTFKASSVHVI